jgi:hypothetical protein
MNLKNFFVLHFLVLLFILNPCAINISFAQVEAPRWTRDLVIYELNPYAFTSPDGAGDGSGSGTFNSLREKLPYLEDLGITAIWLAGYCEATVHFYGIKTVYACITPEKFDPQLGSAEDFKALAGEAENRGIKIFLDVITHGVMNDSPLIRQHPDWFKGGTWGMTDYDYANREFQKWWINVWVKYVEKYGVDGFRLDVPVPEQMPLWDSIASRCRELGKPIVIFPECATAYHFGQKDYINFSWDIAGEYSPTPRYKTVLISWHDLGWNSPVGNYYTIKGNRALAGYNLMGCNIPIIFSGDEFNANQVSLPDLKQGLYGSGGQGGWLYGSWIQWDQLKEEGHANFYEDFKAYLNIRRNNKDILHADREATNILPLNHHPRINPIPYIRYMPGEKAILVAANYGIGVDIELVLDIPLGEMGLDGNDTYLVEDLMHEESTLLGSSEVKKLKTVISPYYNNRRGGIRIIKITPVK